MILASDLKRGLIFQLDSAPCLVLDISLQSPSASEGVFMNLETYDQFEISGDLFDDIKGYLTDGLEVTLGIFNDQVVSIELPLTVELTVTETAPSIKNATATAQTKEAILETGLSLQVPGYLESGERIKVDTREGRFISRC